MKKLRFLLVFMSGAAALAGCSLFPTRAPELLIEHDFGPLHRHRPEPPLRPILLHVKSLSWLSGTNIHYRLLYADPTAVYVYADNRWIAPPSVLLKARIRWRLGLGMTMTAHPPQRLERLVLVLSRFDQDFVGPRRAFVRLTVEGRLYNIMTGTLVAAKTVNLRQACSPNAEGAVTGLSELARKASASFAGFVRRHDPTISKD